MSTAKTETQNNETAAATNGRLSSDNTDSTKTLHLLKTEENQKKKESWKPQTQHMFAEAPPMMMRNDEGKHQK